MGGWVGENEAVGMSYCGLLGGGWVGGKGLYLLESVVLEEVVIEERAAGATKEDEPVLVHAEGLPISWRRHLPTQRHDGPFL